MNKGTNLFYTATVSARNLTSLNFYLSSFMKEGLQGRPMYEFACTNLQCTKQHKIKSGAGAARSRIILVEPEQEPKRDATPAPTVPALNMIYNMGSIKKNTNY
jgi:hypothetical protein